MNPINRIHGNKFIHEVIPTALICQSKHRNDMPLGLRSNANKGTCSHQFSSGRWVSSTLPYCSKAQSLRLSVDLNIGRPALKCSVIYSNYNIYFLISESTYYNCCLSHRLNSFRNLKYRSHKVQTQNSNIPYTKHIVTYRLPYKTIWSRKAFFTKVYYTAWLY